MIASRWLDELLDEYSVYGLEDRAREAGTYDLPVGRRPAGSSLYRTYCAACLEPIRVADWTTGAHYCDACCPRLTLGRRAGPIRGLVAADVAWGFQVPAATAGYV